MAGDQPPTTNDIAATFVIGTDDALEAKTGGRLIAFANDHAGACWNDGGAITLRAAR